MRSLDIVLALTFCGPAWSRLFLESSHRSPRQRGREALAQAPESRRRGEAGEEGYFATPNASVPTAPDLGDPAAWGVTLHEAKLNGIRMRWADTASTDEERARPVILFMHGWPGLWFSWRHQLRVVHAAGYRGLAPDMRGYGGSGSPQHPADYTVYSVAGDMLALLQHVGASTAALVGHDFGATMGWQLAVKHPDIFVCYMAVSVSYSLASPGPPLQGLRKVFGDERKPEEDPEFHYQLHHQLPNAAADYEQDTRGEFMWRYGSRNHTVPAQVNSTKMYVNGKVEPLRRRLPQPTALAPWISQAEFDYYVREYERAGWNGGLNWYRAEDLNWNATPQLRFAQVQQPVAFFAGKSDPCVKWGGGERKTVLELLAFCERLDSITFVEGEHDIQEERPKELNEALLRFVGKYIGKLSPAGGPGDTAIDVLKITW